MDSECTSTVEVEVDWPHFALDFSFFACRIAFGLNWSRFRRHVHPHTDLTLILLPPRDCRLAYPAYTGRVLCRITIQ